MAEKKGKEEYQLPEEENLESHYEEDEIQYTEKPQRASFSPRDILLSKKVLIPTFIILGVYGVYKFMEFRDRQQLKAQQQPKETVPVKAPPQKAPATQVQAPAQTMTPPIPIKEALPSAQNAVQVTVDQTKNQPQFDTLGTQVNQLQLTQTQMNTELNELNETIKVLAAKLDQNKPVIVPSQPCVVVKKKIKRYHRRRIIFMGPSYHIRAVVPGRAWLVSSSGRLFTVRIGDRIAGLGIVENIDVIRGVVIMSSGREITYGKYDS